MNLLTDPLLRVETGAGLEKMTLPDLLAALGEDCVEALTGIQRHQEDVFHVFLCSLAAAILARTGNTDPRQNAAYWREGLRMLAGDAGDDAWMLVVKDLSKPAFMQPPLPKADRRKVKIGGYAPDALDVLVTSKNHDVKQSRASDAEIDEWVYGLVSLQTMSGFSGRDNYGIARMNSGYGNRSIVEVIHSLRLGPRWQDAICRLLKDRENLIFGPWGYSQDGLVLLWLLEWDGKSSKQLSGLDPYFIEIARRWRLHRDGSKIFFTKLTSKCMRLDAESLKGLVGDPWLPIDLGRERKGGNAPVAQALTVSTSGLTADLLRRLLFAARARIKLSDLQRPIPGCKGPVWLSISVLVRGQGTTDGFHERRILIPAAQRPRLFDTKAGADPLADLAQNTIATAGKIQNQVLKPAIFIVLEGAPEQIKFDRKSAQAWWKRFATDYTHRWSDDYFPWLWQTPEGFDIEDRLDEWRQQLRAHALAVLHEAFSTLPRHSGRYWRVRIEARRVFFGAFFKQFPHLKEDHHVRTANA